MLLTTTAALGFKVSIKKGARSSQLTWVGVRLTLTEDHLMMGLPEAYYTTELVTLLKSWEGRGMAPIRELHQAAGKASWLSGKLPRARWVASIFYRVLHARLADIKTGAEDRRRSDRKDNRDKSALFHVKQLEQAQRWLISYLETAMDKPTKKYKLDRGKYPTAAIITDACPEGLGAVLLINNKVIRAYSSPVTQEDARALDFELGNSSSQGIVETLAVVVALKHWAKELSMCSLTLQVQSDSLVALAMTQKMSMKATHIPGSANTTADYLSRPSKHKAVAMPQELPGVPIQQPKDRTAGYYCLPTPGDEDPQLWASAAAAECAWSTLR
jgi:hypothetical protein